MEDLDKLILKALLVLMTAPAWYPFLKAVWEELNTAMADEGGLFGRMPTTKELEQIERERTGQPDPMVHEPWLTAQERMAGRRTMRAPNERSRASAAAPAAPAAKGPVRKSGF